MDEVAQADFRTDAEWRECGGILPRAEVARDRIFYWWKKRLREIRGGSFVEVQVAESPAKVPVDSRIEIRLQNGRSLMVGRDLMRNMCGDCWRWWRQQGDRAAKLRGHGSSARSADLDGQ